MDGQTEVKPYMRETMVDWLIDLHNKLSRNRETLYLSVNIIDRYVSTVFREKTDFIPRSQYQLVGLTAYFIASKYEEVQFVEMSYLIESADNIYTVQDMMNMEIKIVNTLKFDFTVPTTNKFLQRFLRVRSIVVSGSCLDHQ